MADRAALGKAMGKIEEEIGSITRDLKELKEKQGKYGKSGFVICVSLSNTSSTSISATIEPASLCSKPELATVELKRPHHFVLTSVEGGIIRLNRTGEESEVFSAPVAEEVDQEISDIGNLSVSSIDLADVSREILAKDARLAELYGERKGIKDQLSADIQKEQQKHIAESGASSAPAGSARRGPSMYVIAFPPPPELLVKMLTLYSAPKIFQGGRCRRSGASLFGRKAVPSWAASIREPL